MPDPPWLLTKRERLLLAAHGEAGNIWASAQIIAPCLCVSNKTSADSDHVNLDTLETQEGVVLVLS